MKFTPGIFKHRINIYIENVTLNDYLERKKTYSYSFFDKAQAIFANANERANNGMENADKTIRFKVRYSLTRYSERYLIQWENDFYNIRAIDTDTDRFFMVITAERIPPNSLEISPDLTNTVAWYEHTTLVKDSNNRVSNWIDRTGNNNNLIQDTDDNKPLATDTGLYFDGINDFMKTATFTMEQPTTIYMVADVKNIAALTTFFDGFTEDSMPFFIWDAITQLYIGPAEFHMVFNASLSENTTYIFSITINEALSSLKINNIEQLNIGSLTIGTNNLNGFTLGGTDTGGFKEMEVKEIILRNVADTDTEQTNIYNYLANKYNL